MLMARRDSDGKAGAIQVISQLFKTTLELPPRIQAICWAQFWAWIGESFHIDLAQISLADKTRMVSVSLLQYHLGW